MDYSKSELDLSSSKEVPSFLTEVGTRLRVVEKLYKNRATAAKAAGASKSAFQNWVEGKRDPSFRAMATLARASGVSLDWLAFGEGPMYKADTAAPPVAPGLVQTIEGYPPLIPMVMKTKIIGAILSNETHNRVTPIKVFADEVLEMYLSDYQEFITGGRRMPVEVPAEAIESLRPGKKITTKAG